MKHSIWKPEGVNTYKTVWYRPVLLLMELHQPHLPTDKWREGDGDGERQSGWLSGRLLVNRLLNVLCWALRPMDIRWDTMVDHSETERLNQVKRIKMWVLIPLFFFFSVTFSFWHPYDTFLWLSSLLIPSLWEKKEALYLLNYHTLNNTHSH